MAELAALPDELVPLRLKQIARTDRLPEPGGKRPGLSEFPAAAVDTAVTATEPGDEWVGERHAEAALARLHQLVSAQRGEDLVGLLADGFQCSDLHPDGSTRTIGRDLSISEGRADGVVACSAAELVQAIREFGDLKVKIVGVGEADGSTGEFTTDIHAEAKLGGGEYSATWICRWLGGGMPQLLSLRVDEYQTVRSAGSWFADVTRAALGRSPRFDAQVMRGIEFWSQRITRIGDMAMSGHHGIAVGDVDGDGREDIYVCDAGSLPNQLYLQQADGTAREVAAESGVAWLEDSRSALLIDLDNDGDQDLVVATIAMIVFAENDGAGKFVLRGGHPGAPYPFSLSAADFDSDGDLDLYTCVYSAGDDSLSGKRGFEAGSPIPFNDADNGGRNLLLANLGSFRFADVTEQVGLGQNTTRWSFAAAWEDFDRDGDPDLYVANDFGRNSLYRNDGGRFTDIAAASGVEDMAAGMSVAWGDYNRDGEADLYVGNMFSAAGKPGSYPAATSTGRAAAHGARQ